MLIIRFGMKSILNQIIKRFHISGQHAGPDTDIIGNSHLTTIDRGDDRTDFHFWDSWIDKNGGIEQIGVTFVCKGEEITVVLQRGTEESFFDYLKMRNYELDN